MAGDSFLNQAEEPFFRSWCTAALTTTLVGFSPSQFEFHLEVLDGPTIFVDTGLGNTWAERQTGNQNKIEWEKLGIDRNLICRGLLMKPLCLCV